MKKVLVGGTFNIIHAGHIFFLQNAKALGDQLVVIVANDSTVVKNKRLLFPAKRRAEMVKSLKFVDKVLIGDKVHKLKVVQAEKPQIIALGFDQNINEKKLSSELKSHGLKCKIVRIKASLPGYSTRAILKKRGWQLL